MAEYLKELSIDYPMKYAVDIISCTNKIGTDSLKELHYKANAILFQLKNSYIMRNRTIRCGKEIKEIGDNIKALEVSDKAKAKKQEIMNAIDKALVYLRSIRKQEASVDEVQKTINFTVSGYLRNKPSNAREALDQIERMKELVSDIGDIDLSNLKTKAFKQMHKELKELIEREIEFI